MNELEYYPRALAANDKEASSRTLSKLLNLAGLASIGLGVMLAGLTVLFIVIGACTPAWICGILAALLLLMKAPLLALLVAKLDSNCESYHQQAREWMRLACLHGEAPWELYPGGYRFFHS